MVRKSVAFAMRMRSSYEGGGAMKVKIKKNDEGGKGNHHSGAGVRRRRMGREKKEKGKS